LLLLQAQLELLLVLLAADVLEWLLPIKLILLLQDQRLLRQGCLLLALHQHLRQPNSHCKFKLAWKTHTDPKTQS
jgi:hypothetical protein